MSLNIGLQGTSEDIWHYSEKEGKKDGVRGSNEDKAAPELEKQFNYPLGRKILGRNLIAMKGNKEELDNYPEELSPCYESPKESGEPKRHASEMFSLKGSSHPLMKTNPEVPEERKSQATQASRSTTGSASFIPTIQTLMLPPGLPPMGYPCPYEHYSTNCLPVQFNDFMSNIQPPSYQYYPQQYLMGEYYPVYPPMYFPQQTYEGVQHEDYSTNLPKKRLEPKRYNSYLCNPRMQTIPEHIMIPPESSPSLKKDEEYALSVIKEYESSNGDFSVLADKIVLLATFNNGSRYLQMQLTKGNPAFIAAVIDQVIHFCNL